MARGGANEARPDGFGIGVVHVHLVAVVSPEVGNVGVTIAGARFAIRCINAGSDRMVGEIYARYFAGAIRP